MRQHLFNFVRRLSWSISMQYISAKIHSKFSSQPKSSKKSLKTHILGFKVVQSHRCWQGFIQPPRRGVVLPPRKQMYSPCGRTINCINCSGEDLFCNCCSSILSRFASRAHDAHQWCNNISSKWYIESIFAISYGIDIMRVDLSPRLGGHSGQSTPHYTVLLSFTFILPTPPRNGVKSHSRCGTESWTELELAFQVLWPSWLDYGVPTTPCTSRL